MENKKNMNVILAVVICVLLLGVLIFISIRGKTNAPANENIGGATNEQPVATDNTNNIVTTPTPTPAPAPVNGTGNAIAKIGDTVAVNYTGRLANGTVFDSNIDPKFGHVTPFVFTLGAGQVIPGWDKGIVGMKVGEKKTLVIPPEDAYGAAGAGGVIPPNATLTFDVELLAIKK
jgi:peptidylprolyl isomerase